MQWLAVACTAENQVLAWSENLSILESACQNDFRAISRIYGVDDLPAQQLRQFNLDFRIQFDGPRNTKFVPHRKDIELVALSHNLQSKVGLMVELQQRLAHGFKRFEVQYPWQSEAYEEKYKQAMTVIDGGTGETGMVSDYAEESGLTVNVAAGLIVNKYQNRKFLIRKLERLRARHQIAIRNAKTKDDLALCRKAMEEDSFLSMMM
jgi:hypothetical protein